MNQLVFGLSNNLYFCSSGAWITLPNIDVMRITCYLFALIDVLYHP